MTVLDPSPAADYIDTYGWTQHKHGFTREHYDTLTGPWRQVIGPVHPEDVAA